MTICVYPSVCLFVCPSVCLSVCTSKQIGLVELEMCFGWWFWSLENILSGSRKCIYKNRNPLDACKNKNCRFCRDRNYY